MKNQILNGLFTRIKSTLLQHDKSTSKDELDSLLCIKEGLSHLPEERANYLAAFSFLLFRVAHADSHVSDDEESRIESLLETWGNLNKEQARIVAKISRVENRLKGGTDNYLVSREFKEISTDAQKSELLHCLFAVAASDDAVMAVESDTIRMISRELGLDHDAFIEIRRNFADKLAALR